MDMGVQGQGTIWNGCWRLAFWRAAEDRRDNTGLEQPALPPIYISKNNMDIAFEHASPIRITSSTTAGEERNMVQECRNVTLV